MGRMTVGTIGPMGITHYSSFNPQKEIPMSILTVFTLSSMNAEKYNRVISDLDAAGQGKPKGRLYHIASRQEDGSFVVTDVWESAELLDEFGKTLMPIL